MEKNQNLTAAILTALAMVMVMVTVVTIPQIKQQRHTKQLHAQADPRVEEYAQRLQFAQRFAVQEMHITSFKACTDVSLQAQGMPSKLPDFVKKCEIIQDPHNHRFDLTGVDNTLFTIVTSKGK